LNVTPDSFSDGGKYLDPDRAFAHALHMEEQGADIIDVGAESTRPDSVRISAAEELRRLIPVLKRLRNQLTIPLSVDTYKAEVAELAIHHGAEIINDPTGLTFDPQLLATLGRLCAHAELWGKARSFLEASLSFEESRAACLDLARLAEQLGEPAEAQRHFRKAAELP
jgi:dihydropteroate synthase